MGAWDDDPEFVGLIDALRGRRAHWDWHDAMAKDTHNESPLERQHWLQSLLPGMVKGQR